MTKQTKSGKTSKAPQVQPRVRTPQERVAELTKFIEMRLAQHSEDAVEAAQTFAKKVSESKENPLGAFLYQMEWAQGPVQQVSIGFYVESAKLWTKSFVERDGMTPEAALYQGLDSQIKRCTEDLINNRMRGGSTSAFHNAVEDGKREAASRFVGMYRDICDELGKAIAAAQASEVFAGGVEGV